MTSNYSPSKREKIFISIWLLYGLLTAAGVAYKGFSQDTFLRGDICGALSLGITILLLVQYVPQVNKQPAELTLGGSYIYIAVSYLLSSIIYIGQPQFVMGLITPLILYMAFPGDYRFIGWLNSDKN